MSKGVESDFVAAFRFPAERRDAIARAARAYRGAESLRGCAKALGISIRTLERMTAKHEDLSDALAVVRRGFLR